MVVILVLLGVVALVVTLYNRFVRLRNGADAAWSDIDVQLKRRWELVPNLVETVKGYAAHERTTFEEVTRARSAAMQASTRASRGVGGAASEIRPLRHRSQAFADYDLSSSGRVVSKGRLARALPQIAGSDRRASSADAGGDDGIAFLVVPYRRSRGATTALSPTPVLSVDTSLETSGGRSRA